MRKIDNNSSKKVLILRPDNIGDVVLFSGALKHLRKCYPDAFLTLAVQPHIVNLVELCIYVDECLSVEELLPSRDGNLFYRVAHRYPSTKRALNLFFRKKPVKYDQVIYPVRSVQPLHLELIKQLGAKESVGIVGCDVNLLNSRGLKPGNVFDRTLDISGLDPWRHEFQTTVDFLNFLGCQIDSVDEIAPELWLSRDDIDRVVNFKRPGRKIVGLFPGAFSRIRLWAPENYARLAQLLGPAFDFVLFGGPSDEEVVSKVEEMLQPSTIGEIFNLVGKTTLRELAKSIQSCDLFIGMETSGIHVAIASGTKTICILGGGHYGRFAPWGDLNRHVFLTNQKDCRQCNWRCHDGLGECIQGVTPEVVADQAFSLLG